MACCCEHTGVCPVRFWSCSVSDYDDDELYDVVRNSIEEQKKSIKEQKRLIKKQQDLIKKQLKNVIFF